MSEHSLPSNVALAIDSVRHDLLPWWQVYSRPIDVVFPAAATKRDVAHELQQVPDGFLLVMVDGVVYAEPGVPWTKEVAYLRSTGVNVRARIIFYTLREVPHEA